jgi:hypothetical protein
MVIVLLVADFVLVNHIKDLLSLATFPDATWTLFLVSRWVIFPDLWLWIVLTAGWSALVTAYFIRRLPQQIDLKVISSHPDQCGGLKPIGDICLQLALIAVIASIVLAYWGSVGRVLRTAGVVPRLSDEKVEEVVEQLLPETLKEFKELLNPAREGEEITRRLADFGTIAGIFGGGWLFLYPVLGIHELMKDKKAQFAQALADVAWEFDIELEQSIRAKDGRKINEAHDKLEALQHSYSLLQNYPVWPTSRKNFVIGFIAPEFFTVIGVILNVNTEILDSVLEWIRQWLLTPST